MAPDRVSEKAVSIEVLLKRFVTLRAPMAPSACRWSELLSLLKGDISVVVVKRGSKSLSI